MRGIFRLSWPGASCVIPPFLALKTTRFNCELVLTCLFTPSIGRNPPRRGYDVCEKASGHGLLLPAADREPQSSSQFGNLSTKRAPKRSRDPMESSSSFTVLLPVSAPEIAYLPVASVPPEHSAPFVSQSQEDDVFSVFEDDGIPSSKRLCQLLSTDYDDEANQAANSRLASVLPAGHGQEVLPSPMQWGASECFFGALGEEEVFC
mmetsp:Transcript_869/g.2097  ORF Transcript_869/g.2097 Transcript_869/m.2097 type:complete len:206 (+) Transcript_869:56-673(+)